MSEHDSEIEKVAACPFSQDSQCSDEGQAAPSRFAASIGVVQRELIGVKLRDDGRRNQHAIEQRRREVGLID